MNYKNGFTRLKMAVPEEQVTIVDELEKEMNYWVTRQLLTPAKVMEEQLAILDKLNNIALIYTKLTFADLCAETAVNKRGLHKTPARRNIKASKIGKYWALVIGINKYGNDFSDLRYAVNDAKALTACLEEFGYNALLLSDNQSDSQLHPTRVNIITALRSVGANIDSEDLFLLYFAGHGLFHNGKSYIVAQDTRSGSLDISGIAIELIKDEMNKSKAKRKILILDACQIGAGRGKNQTSDFIRNVYETATGFALLAASSSDQQSHESDDFKHGIFTYYLLEGIYGSANFDDNSFVTIDEIKKYVLDKVRSWYIRNLKGEYQDPYHNLEGIGDMILIDCGRKKWSEK